MNTPPNIQRAVRNAAPLLRQVEEATNDRDEQALDDLTADMAKTNRGQGA